MGTYTPEFMVCVWETAQVFLLASTCACIQMAYDVRTTIKYVLFAWSAVSQTLSLILSGLEVQIDAMYMQFMSMHMFMCTL